jgi:hypothetical protein
MGSAMEAVAEKRAKGEGATEVGRDSGKEAVETAGWC